MRKDVRYSTLQDMFVFRDGSRVQNTADWEKRREEIIEDVIGLAYDGMPPKPEVFAVEQLVGFGRGRAVTYRIQCGRKDKPFWFCFTAYLPNIEGKLPVVLTGDGVYVDSCCDAVIAEAHRRGFAVVKFHREEMAPDMRDNERKYGINALWPELDFTAISAWAWGYHRVVDALFTLDWVDTDNIAITGHSRGGKTVLLAGATDTRIRFVNPNDSGTHGCGSYHFYQQEDDGEYREPLEFMMRVIPYWMGKGLAEYVNREGDIPYDTHFIKALVAPRCFLETNAYGDIWANPRGSYLTWQAAKEAWKLYGAEDRICTWYREGDHNHGMEDFCALFDFMEANMYGKPYTEALVRVPYDDMEPLHEWSCPAGK